eukprot:tig00021244_g19579.t1
MSSGSRPPSGPSSRPSSGGAPVQVGSRPSSAAKAIEVQAALAALPAAAIAAVAANPDLPPGSLAFMEQQLFPTLLPAIAQLLKTVDGAGIVPTAGAKPTPIWARPTSAHPGMIKSKVPQRDRPASAPAYMDKRHFEPLHWLAAYLMRHNPKPKYHSWAEKQAADERAAEEARVREEAERAARQKMVEELARRAEEERQERLRIEEEERRKEEERLEAERKREEEERERREEELRQMAEAEKRKAEEEEKARKAAEDKEKHDLAERRKREKEEAERARRERDEAFMRRQREIKAVETALQTLQAIVSRFKPGDSYEAALAELRSVATEAARRIGKGSGGFVYLCEAAPAGREEGAPVEALDCVFSADAATSPAPASPAPSPRAPPASPRSSPPSTPGSRRRRRRRRRTGAAGSSSRRPSACRAPRTSSASWAGRTSPGPPRPPPRGRRRPRRLPAVSPHPSATQQAAAPAALATEDVQRLQQLGEQLGLCAAGLATAHAEGARTLAVQAVKELVMKKAAPATMYAAFMEVVRPFCPAARAMWVPLQDHPFQLRLYAADEGAKALLGLEAGQTQRRPGAGEGEGEAAAPPPSEFDAIAREKYTLVPDLEAAGQNAYFGRPPRGAVMTVPLKDATGKGRGCVGAVSVYKDGEAFGEGEVDMILMLAEQLAPAVEDATHAAARALEAYIADNEGHGQLNPLHQLVIDALLAHTTATAAYVAIVDPAQGGALQYVAAGPAEQDALLVGQVVPPGTGVTWQATAAVKPGAAPQPMHVPSVRAEPAVHYLGPAGADGADGPYVCLPMVDKEGEVIGVVAMDGLGGDHGKAGFTPWDLDFFAAMAKGLGAAHERAERRRRSMLVLEGAIGVLKSLVNAPVAFAFTDKVPKGEEAADKTIVPVTGGHLGNRAFGYLMPHDVDDWKKIRQLVSDELKPRIAAYDPTVKQKKAKFRRVDAEMKGLTAEEVREKGSVAAERMYSWVALVVSIRRAVVELRRLHGTMEEGDEEEDLADTLSSAPSDALRPTQSRDGRRPSYSRDSGAANRRASLESAGSAGV